MLRTLSNSMKKIMADVMKTIHDKQPAALNKQAKDSDYFKTAGSWQDDYYGMAVATLARYKLTCWVLVGVCALLIMTIAILVPVQHTELVVVHQGQSGYTWLSTTTEHERIKPSWARTQSEIAHYVRTRAAYDPLFYRRQSHEVALLSTPEVLAQYELAQSGDNKSAPINVLGSKGYRTVTINNVLPLDHASHDPQPSDHHVNLAQVDYVVVDHFYGQQQTVKTPYTALVSWRYDGIPADPLQQFGDWDGFRVTKFIVQPVNTDQTA